MTKFLLAMFRRTSDTLSGGWDRRSQPSYQAKPETGHIDYASLRTSVMTRLTKTRAYLATR